MIFCLGHLCGLLCESGQARNANRLDMPMGWRWHQDGDDIRLEMTSGWRWQQAGKAIRVREQMLLPGFAISPVLWSSGKSIDCPQARGTAPRLEELPPGWRNCPQAEGTASRLEELPLGWRNCPQAGWPLWSNCLQSQNSRKDNYTLSGHGSSLVHSISQDCSSFWNMTTWTLVSLHTASS